MYRLFYRSKSTMSLKHKMLMKGDKYRDGISKIQDMLGFRVVLYFPDDVNILAEHFSLKDVLDRSMDEPDACTFSPRRLNLTMRIPERYISDFRAALPEDYAQYIDDSYEMQLRTVFSEGWHEVEHDLRYKCKEDWVGYENYSRNLNGIIACLENAEWSVMTLLDKMAEENRHRQNFRAMFRNKFRLRLKSEDFSEKVSRFLAEEWEKGKRERNKSENAKDVISELNEVDRSVLIITLLLHTGPITLTYDRLFFLINRLFLYHPEIMQLESEEDRKELDEFIAS